MKICKPNNGLAPVEIMDMPTAWGNHSPAKFEHAADDGWLLYAPSDQAHIKSSTWRVVGDADGSVGGAPRLYLCAYQQQDIVTYTAEELAIQEAARLAAIAEEEAFRKATPVVWDRALEVPLLSILSQSARKGVGITATDEGDLVTVIVHESPWPDKATLDAKIAASIATHKAAKDTAKAGISGQLQTRIENIERLLGLRP